MFCGLIKHVTMELTAAPPSVWFRIKIDQVTYNKVKVRINFFLKVCLKIISLDASTFPSETVIKLEKKYCKIFQTANPTTMGTKMEYSSVWSEKKQNSTFWDKILVMERNFYKFEVIVIKIWYYKAGVFFRPPRAPWGPLDSSLIRTDGAFFSFFLKRT